MGKKGLRKRERVRSHEKRRRNPAAQQLQQSSLQSSMQPRYVVDEERGDSYYVLDSMSSYWLDILRNSGKCVNMIDLKKNEKGEWEK